MRRNGNACYDYEREWIRLVISEMNRWAIRTTLANSETGDTYG